MRCEVHKSAHSTALKSFVICTEIILFNVQQKAKSTQIIRFMNIVSRIYAEKQPKYLKVQYAFDII